MRRLPRPAWMDYASLVAIGATLLVAYALVPRPIVQYGAWLVVFCVWMAWFITAAVRIIPHIDTR